jgi:hypothetical protein
MVPTRGPTTSPKAAYCCSRLRPPTSLPPSRPAAGSRSADIPESAAGTHALWSQPRSSPSDILIPVTRSRWWCQAFEREDPRTSPPPFASSLTVSAAIRHLRQHQRRSRSWARSHIQAAVGETLRHLRGYRRRRQHREGLGLLRGAPLHEYYLPPRTSVITKIQGWEARRGRLISWTY